MKRKNLSVEKNSGKKCVSNFNNSYCLCFSTFANDTELHRFVYSYTTLSVSLCMVFEDISQCCDIETLGDHILVVYIFLSQSQALNLVSFNHIHMSVIEPDMMLIKILPPKAK